MSLSEFINRPVHHFYDLCGILTAVHEATHPQSKERQLYFNLIQGTVLFAGYIFGDKFSIKEYFIRKYSKTCVKRPLSKRPKSGFQDQLSLNAGQKYCRMLQGEQSSILLTFIKLPFVIKIFVLSIF